jgi:hypothetical protein
MPINGRDTANQTHQNNSHTQTKHLSTHDISPFEPNLKGPYQRPTRNIFSYWT